MAKIKEKMCSVCKKRPPSSSRAKMCFVCKDLKITTNYSSYHKRKKVQTEEEWLKPSDRKRYISNKRRITIGRKRSSLS